MYNRTYLLTLFLKCQTCGLFRAKLAVYASYKVMYGIIELVIFREILKSKKAFCADLN